ncbi:surface lipoprotein assembly modifier [Phaeovulum sp. W22_SRMD_FR3]|uniref:surface lipoprotein assembly modifier n=1 Tax=Phaeovulum sp. W22_SRMD_FR3 TaxID=3240274 RepID=UPI003F9B783A
MMGVLLLWLIPLAASAAPLDDAERAIKDGQPAEALAVLDRFPPRTDTEILRKLWLTGVAYQRAGQAQAAVAPLTRLVAQVPQNPTFRLELASALIRSNQTERARYHLEQVKGTGLPPELQTRVQTELDRLQKPKQWQGYFRFALIPESNAARRTAAETVNLGALVFTLAPSVRQQPANGVELGFGLAALPLVSDRLRARFGADLQARIFDGNAPDDVILRANTALLSYGSNGRLLSAELFATQRWLDNAVYSRSAGLSLSYARNLGSRTRLSVQGQHEDIRYNAGRYDVLRDAASLQLAYAASGQLMLRLGARFENRSSRNAQAAGHAAGVTVGGDYSFAGGLRLGLDLFYDRNAFDGVHPLFGVQRLDRKLAATLQLTNQNWNYRGFAPVLKLGVERQKSSISLNSYRNLSASIGVTRSF